MTDTAKKRGPTRIWIARHGQTEANRTGLFCGHSETALTDLGRAQAAALGRRLGEVDFQAVYTSGLSRANETAALAIAGRGLTPRVDLDLRELHYGEWEMQRDAEIRKMSPEQHRLMRAEDPAWHPPGGENITIVRERTAAALRRIVAAHKHEDVLVVSHGTAINCMLSEILGMAPSHTFRFDVANCGISQVVLHGTRLVVTRLNETAHLDGVTATNVSRQ